MNMFRSIKTTWKLTLHIAPMAKSDSSQKEIPSGELT